MGGSQGAVGVNRMVRPLLPRLCEAGVRVVHLTGHNDPESGAALPEGVVELPFCDAMAGLLQHCDLAISRSGAGALSELAVCGTPAILVPYPIAADRHQDANAAAAAALGAAVIVERVLWRLLGPRLRGGQVEADLLLAMRQGMGQLAVRDADQRLADLLSELV
jgi:UDP-N-acetylglucosamine--N-acetylmuramyl-(pentapeptide) pyrophosphoryl-undecaprenol N-acetylglucosamine transferase